jgi:KDO2-lipid IV(A) lauroyltransferase
LSKFLVKLWLYSIAILPFPLLYLLSDILYAIVFYLLKYRRAVVAENLKMAFPEKSDKERAAIEKQFFKDLAALVLETIKLLAINKSSILKRCTIKETEGSRHYFSSKKGAVILTAHTSNWEWAGNVIGIHTDKRPVQVVYLRLRNKMFNHVMKQIRTRFGNSVIHMEMAFREILKHKQEGIVSCFLADQSPQVHQVGHWSMFLNQATPFFSGPEKIARKLDQNVYFGKISRLKRGYYQIELSLITDTPAATPEGYIMEQYARRLEQAIIEQPSTWLWSHRRWKHSKHAPPEMLAQLQKRME